MNTRGESWGQKILKSFSEPVKNWTPEMIGNRNAAVFGMQIDAIELSEKERDYTTKGLNDYGGRMRKAEENGMYSC